MHEKCSTIWEARLPHQIMVPKTQPTIGIDYADCAVCEAQTQLKGDSLAFGENKEHP
jgi:hypothetical protein